MEPASARLTGPPPRIVPRPTSGDAADAAHTHRLAAAARGTTTAHPDARAGALWGTAYGDATGADTEFTSHDRITDLHGDDGPPALGNGRITDDTQMTLALDKALRDTRGMTGETIRAAILAEYLAWYADPDNDRAPGRTCLHSLANLHDLTGLYAHDGLTGLIRDNAWADATDPTSKGCGTVMRAAPAGFLPDELIDPVSAYAAALTHGHPTAVAAAILTARTVRAAGDGNTDPLTYALDLARARAVDPDAEWVVDHGWLAHVPNRAGHTDPYAYLTFGYAECVTALEHAQAARTEPATDVSRHAGGGWVADECLAAALLAWAWHPTDPVAAIRRAAAADGDADSIAAVTGAVVGALTRNGWPHGWQEQIEPRYRDWLLEAVAGTVTTR